MKAVVEKVDVVKAVLEKVAVVVEMRLVVVVVVVMAVGPKEKRLSKRVAARMNDIYSLETTGLG